MILLLLTLLLDLHYCVQRPSSALSCQDGASSSLPTGSQLVWRLTYLQGAQKLFPSQVWNSCRHLVVGGQKSAETDWLVGRLQSLELMSGDLAQHALRSLHTCPPEQV